MKYAWIVTLLCVTSAFGALDSDDHRAEVDVESRSSVQVINSSSPLIWYHGRWDDLPSSWWCVRPSYSLPLTHSYLTRPGSGFKLSFTKAPTSLTISIGNTSVAPPIPVAARFGEVGEWVTLNLTAGANALPLTSIGLVDSENARYPLVLDVVTQFETNGLRLELKSIELDEVSARKDVDPRIQVNGNWYRRQS
jgi:hypothetical protein